MQSFVRRKTYPPLFSFFFGASSSEEIEWYYKGVNKRNLLDVPVIPGVR